MLPKAQNRFSALPSNPAPPTNSPKWYVEPESTFLTVHWDQRAEAKRVQVNEYQRSFYRTLFQTFSIPSQLSSLPEVQTPQPMPPTLHSPRSANAKEEWVPMAHDPDPGEAVEVKVIRLRRFVADFNRQYNWTPLLPEPLKNYIDRWNYCVDHNLVGQAHVVHSAGEDLPHNIRYCGCPFTCIKQPRSADSGYYPFQPQMMQRFLDDYNTIYSSELGPPAAIEFFSHVLGIFREVRDIDQEYIRDAFRAVGPDQVSNLYSVLFSLTPYSLAENRSFTEFPLRGPLPEIVVDPDRKSVV